MVFTANSGFTFENQVWISSFKNKERKPESQHFKDWFENEGFEIINNEFNLETTPSFEGAGDALSVNNHLAMGYGYRSEPRIVEITSFFQKFNLAFCELINPYFYHLDTCFCPIDSVTALWYPHAFGKSSQTMMLDMCELIAVSEKEAKNFACNAVVIENNIILPSECPDTHYLLKMLGFNVYECEMSEFIKAGGACKCLTLTLDSGCNTDTSHLVLPTSRATRSC